MSLVRKLLIVRWLEREQPDYPRPWKKHAARVVRARRALHPLISPLEKRALMLQKLERLLKEAEEGKLDAAPGDDTGVDQGK